MVTYTFATPAKQSGVYSFSFPSALVSDRAETPNTSAAFNYTIDFGSASGTFDVTSVTTTASVNVFEVNYPVAVKGGSVANSATDLANYTIAGKPLAAGTTIYLDVNQKVATITLPADSVSASDATAIVTVANVKSLTGDTVNYFVGTVKVVDNTKPVLTTAVINPNGTVSLGFSEALTGSGVGTQADFSIKLNGTTLVTATTSAFTIANGIGSDSGKYVVTVNTMATSVTGISYLFVDANGNGAFDNGTDVVVNSSTTTTYSAGTYDLNLSSGLVIATATAPTMVMDLAGILLKGSTSITVK